MKKPKHKRSTGNPARHKAKSVARSRAETAAAKSTAVTYSRQMGKHPAARSIARTKTAVATRYTGDDRATLGLFLAPFVIVALSLGLQQSYRAWPAREPVTIAATPSRPDGALPVAATRPAAAAPVAMAPLVPSAPAAPAATGPIPLEPISLQSMSLESQRVTTQLRRAPAPGAERMAALAPVPTLAPAVPVQPPAIALPDIAATPLARLELLVMPRLELLITPAVEPIPLPQLALLPLPVPVQPPAPSLTPIATAPIAPAPMASPRAPPETCLAPAHLPGTAPVYAPPPVNVQGDPGRFGLALAAAAREQSKDFVIYNARYSSIRYPMGDVPQMYGVCTDVVVRAYRTLGVDLQELIQTTKSGRGDRHIDHRRVDTVRRFLERHGETLPKSQFAEDYAAGDIVTYYRPQNRSSTTHIAIVTDIVAPSGRPMIVHNRGWGPQLEDALFVDQITGHFRFNGALRGKGQAIEHSQPSDLAPRQTAGVQVAMMPPRLPRPFIPEQSAIPMSRFASAATTTVGYAAAATTGVHDGRMICRPGTINAAIPVPDQPKGEKKPQRPARFATAATRNSTR